VPWLLHTSEPELRDLDATIKVLGCIQLQDVKIKEYKENTRRQIIYRRFMGFR